MKIKCICGIEVETLECEMSPQQCPNPKCEMDWSKISNVRTLREKKDSNDTR